MDVPRPNGIEVSEAEDRIVERPRCDSLNHERPDDWRARPRNRQSDLHVSLCPAPLRPRAARAASLFRRLGRLVRRLLGLFLAGELARLLDRLLDRPDDVERLLGDGRARTRSAPEEAHCNRRLRERDPAGVPARLLGEQLHGGVRPFEQTATARVRAGVCSSRRALSRFRATASGGSRLSARHACDPTRTHCDPTQGQAPSLLVRHLYTYVWFQLAL